MGQIAFTICAVAAALAWATTPVAADGGPVGGEPPGGDRPSGGADSPADGDIRPK